MKPEEINILAGCGLYPDAVVIFEVHMYVIRGENTETFLGFLTSEPTLLP